MLYKPTALVADGCQTFSRYMSLVLGRMGLDTVPSSSGDEAVRLTKVFRPDVIVLDTGVPRLDGIGTLKCLKRDEDTTNIPVIMVSVCSERRVREHCESIGSAAYLTKPVSVMRLHETLKGRFILKDGQNGCRRKHLRSSWSEMVNIHAQGAGQTYHATVLSEGGMFVACDKPLPTKTSVVVGFPIRDGAIVELKGRVIRIESVYHRSIAETESGMAIVFDDIPRSLVADLREKVLSLLLDDVDAAHVVPSHGV